MRPAVSITEPSFDRTEEVPETAIKVESSESSRRVDVLEQLAQARRDLSDVIAALQLLGLRRCVHCGKFLDISKPGSLFGSSTLVCYGCIPSWWPSFCKDLDVTRREKLEVMLASWLRSYHGAKIIKEEHGKMPEIASPSSG